MGRPLRRQEPGQLYLVTTRCHQARFFLRPDPQVNAAVLEWLTRAQHHYPALEILAVCVLSNHLHLVVRDQKGELAAWASYFLGHLAKSINRIRKRRGTCFERRYSAEPILDEEALLQALTERRLRGAALDVLQHEPLPADHPFWALENVLVTPHVSGTSGRFWERQTDLIVRNIRRYLAGEELENQVDKERGY